MGNEERNVHDVPKNLVTADSKGLQANQDKGAAREEGAASLFTGRPAGSEIESRPASLDSVIPSTVG